MKQILLLFSVLFLLNCSTQNRENESSTFSGPTNEHSNEQTELYLDAIPTSEPQLADSNFNSFLVEFSTNKEFQLTRVDFPLNVKLLDIEDNEENITIAKDDWDHEYLLDTANIETRNIDAYSQQTELSDSSATIKLRGIDNGIRIDYNFELRNGRWYLTDIFNAST
ncbi:DUF4348 domain-containing protein [Marinoscillum pacificum]|uniref:DUF4348 domain-containing protein n=1 Tax=Marinoscillum pacificum TaxID=392723 RepID=UPI002157A16B|nr:DUF4348 domain-containing protein [Marinoscillum pacificum]